MKSHLNLKSCSFCSAESISQAEGIRLHYIFSSSVLPPENLTHSDVKANGEIFPLPLYHASLEEGLWLGRNKTMCRALGTGAM